MAGQRTTYNLRLIRQDYSYNVQDIVKMFEVDSHTVLRWVKEGLKVIPESRPYLIHSSSLHGFLFARQAKRKHPCQPNQIFCMKCRLPRCVQQGSLVVATEPKFLRAKGKCEVCGTSINKLVNPKDWGENHPLYHCMKPSVEQHNGVAPPQRSCPVEKGGQLCLDLTP